MMERAASGSLLMTVWSRRATKHRVSGRTWTDDGCAGRRRRATPAAIADCPPRSAEPSTMPAPPERVLNRKLSQIFRMRGLALRPDAMQPLYDVLQGDEGWEATLKILLSEIQNQGPAGGNVDAADVRAAIAKLRTRTAAKPTLPLEVIDAFEMQPLRFDAQRKTLVADPASPTLHAPAPAVLLGLLLGRDWTDESRDAPLFADGARHAWRATVNWRQFSKCWVLEELL